MVVGPGVISNFRTFGRSFGVSQRFLFFSFFFSFFNYRFLQHLVTSCYGTRDALWPDGSLGSCEDFTLPKQRELSCLLCVTEPVIRLQSRASAVLQYWRTVHCETCIKLTPLVHSLVSTNTGCKFKTGSNILLNKG